jgi:hypothetical protein
MERLIVSFNWAIGTIILLIGLIWPYLNVYMFLPAIRMEAEGTINLLANAERQFRDLQRPFVLFKKTEFPSNLAQKVTLPTTRRYEYDAFIDEKGHLILRAYSKPDEVMKGNIIPGIYELSMDSVGGGDNGRWLGLSSTKRLLF